MPGEIDPGWRVASGFVTRFDYVFFQGLVKSRFFDSVNARAARARFSDVLTACHSQRVVDERTPSASTSRRVEAGGVGALPRRRELSSSHRAFSSSPASTAHSSSPRTASIASGAPSDRFQRSSQRRRLRRGRSSSRRRRAPRGARAARRRRPGTRGGPPCALTSRNRASLLSDDPSPREDFSAGARSPLSSATKRAATADRRRRGVKAGRAAAHVHVRVQQVQRAGRAGALRRRAAGVAAALSGTPRRRTVRHALEGGDGRHAEMARRSRSGRLRRVPFRWSEKRPRQTQRGVHGAFRRVRETRVIDTRRDSGVVCRRRLGQNASRPRHAARIGGQTDRARLVADARAKAIAARHGLPRLGGVRAARVRSYDSYRVVLGTTRVPHPQAHRPAGRRTTPRSGGPSRAGAARRANAKRRKTSGRPLGGRLGLAAGRWARAHPRVAAAARRWRRAWRSPGARRSRASTRRRRRRGARRPPSPAAQASEAVARSAAESAASDPPDADPPRRVARHVAPLQRGRVRRAAHHGLQRVKVSTDERARAGARPRRPAAHRGGRARCVAPITERGFRRPVTPRRGGEERLERPLVVVPRRDAKQPSHRRACSPPRHLAGDARRDAPGMRPRETPLRDTRSSRAKNRSVRVPTNACIAARVGFDAVSRFDACFWSFCFTTPRRPEARHTASRWHAGAGRRRRTPRRARDVSRRADPAQVPRRARSRPRAALPIPSQDVSGRVGFSARAGWRARRAARARPRRPRLRPLRRSPHPRARRGATAPPPPPGPARAPGPPARARARTTAPIWTTRSTRTTDSATSSSSPTTPNPRTCSR